MSLAEFADACREIGRDRALVQGGAGNISFKPTGMEMIIKASGLNLADVTREKGYVSLNHQTVRDFLSGFREISYSRQIEAGYIEACKAAVIGKSDFVPSIETGFHVLLGNSVIHTHAVLITALVSAAGGKELIQEAFSGEDFVWVPYTTPGAFLSREVARRLRQAGKTGEENGLLIFLENHGPIVVADDMRQCLNRHNVMLDKARHFLAHKGVKIPDFKIPQLKEGQTAFQSRLVGMFMKQPNPENLLGYQVPDAVVYCGCGFSFNESDASRISLFGNGRVELPKDTAINKQYMAEMLITMVYNLLLELQFSRPKYIGKEDEMIIRGMLAEKYRQKISRERK